MQEFTTSLAQAATNFLPPSEPDVSSLLRFHRAPDGYVTLHRKPTADTFTNLGGFLPGDLEQIFPSMREELERDSFFSVNAFAFELKRGKSQHLRYLNACYLDLDSYNLSSSEALGKVVQSIGEGTLPSPSIFGLSGRGIWCYWLLRDVTLPDQPQRAFLEKRLLCSRIQKALYQRVKKRWPELEPDANALDLVRVTRIPGSTNGKSGGKKVCHRASLTPDGRRRYYTLHELCDFLGLEEKASVPAKILRFGRRLPKRRNGWIARWKKALRWFETLRDTRGGGFAEGCRNNALYCYANLLRRNRVSEGEVFKRVDELGGQCRPPLDEAAIVGAVISTQGLQATIHISTARMAAMLKVTPEEAEALAPFAPKARAPRGKKRSARMTARRERIREIVAELGEVPPATDISRILKRDGFPGSSLKNVARDLEALGLASPRKRRPRKRERQPCLPELELNLPEIDFTVPPFEVEEFPVFDFDTPELDFSEVPEWDFNTVPKWDFSAVS